MTGGFARRLAMATRPLLLMIAALVVGTSATYAVPSSHTSTTLAHADDRATVPGRASTTTVGALDPAEDPPGNRLSTARYAYDDPANLVRNKAQSSRYRSAPRALPAARQVEAAWGPARQYADGPGRMTAIEHINYRHAFNSGFDDVSRFAQGVGPRQIQGYVDEALRYGNVTQGGASIRHNLGRVSGYDRAGNPVSGIQVWVRDGYIRTAYPVAP
jgi:hypothetical protein